MVTLFWLLFEQRLLLLLLRLMLRMKMCSKWQEIFCKGPRRPAQKKASRAQGTEDAAAQKKAAQEAKEAADLRQKQDADRLLQRSGFVRGFVDENGKQQANLVHDGWLLIAIPRDGHCLMRSFLQILQMRQPDHAMKTHQEMRAELVAYFERHNNRLQIDDVFFECDSLEAMRTGQDSSSQNNYYGGLPECVAFSYRFGISLVVYAPESIDGPVIISGGGHTDHAPEAIIVSFGWRGNTRTPGTDHWQRMINLRTSVLAQSSIVPKENCVAKVDGTRYEAKVKRSLVASGLWVCRSRQQSDSYRLFRRSRRQRGLRRSLRRGGLRP